MVICLSHVIMMDNKCPDSINNLAIATRMVPLRPGYKTFIHERSPMLMKPNSTKVAYLSVLYILEMVCIAGKAHHPGINNMLPLAIFGRDHAC